MIDWVRTVQGIAAIVAVIFATLVAWWNPGLPRLVFSPELASTHAPDRGTSCWLAVHASGPINSRGSDGRIRTLAAASSARSSPAACPAPSDPNLHRANAVSLHR